jgi:hypothetical protein
VARAAWWLGRRGDRGDEGTDAGVVEGAGRHGGRRGSALAARSGGAADDRRLWGRGGGGRVGAFGLRGGGDEERLGEKKHGEKRNAVKN